MVFKDLSAAWLERLSARKRKPCKPATLETFESRVRTHINPLIGEVDVEIFQNKQLRDFAEALVAKALAPKTIFEVVSLVQQIIKSAQDENGNILYIRNWNADFVLERVPEIGNQKQPTITKEQLCEALKVRNASTDKYRIVVALLCASGLRVGELTALRVGDDGIHSGWDKEGSLLAVHTSLWRGKEQLPKTVSSIRLVDLSDSVNEMLAAYVQDKGKNFGDYLFATKNKTPFSPTSLQKLALAPLGIPGFHSCRRWRITHLKMAGTPEPLLKAWAGHSTATTLRRVMTRVLRTGSGESRGFNAWASGLIFLSMWRPLHHNFTPRDSRRGNPRLCKPYC